MVIEISYFIGSFIGAVVFWFLIILYFRHQFFYENGDRKKEIPTSDPTLLSTELAKHGDGVYKDLDLFFKLTLLVFTGVIVLLLKDTPEQKIPLVTKLIEYSRWLQFFSLSFSTLFVLTHKRSSILRWKNRFSWWEIAWWGDTWGYISASLITFYFIFIGVPQLVNIAGFK